MEALVIIFGEILLACLMPVLALAGALLGAIVEALAAVFGGVFALWAERRRAKRQAAGTGGAPAVPRKPLIPRKLLHWFAGGLGALALVGVIASLLFMEPILRFVMDKAAARTGAVVAFEAAEGNLLMGRVALTGVTARREGGERVGFDIRADWAKADVVLLSLLSGTPEIEIGAARGVRGYVSLPAPDKDTPRAQKKKRAFRINELNLRDVALEVRPEGKPAYPVTIETAEVAPLRSALALFDLLFRSNMSGEIAGQSIEVSTRKTSERGRETAWMMRDVEADKLRQILPRAPLTWLQGGRVNVAVTDSWDLIDERIEMDWRVSMRDMEVKVPKGAGATQALLGAALSRVVKAKGGDADFHYRLMLDEEGVASLRSGDLDAFWDVVLSGFLKDGAQAALGKAAPDPAKAGDPQGDARQGKIKGALGKVKSLLKRDAPDE